MPSSAYAMTASEEGREAFFVVPEPRGRRQAFAPKSGNEIFFLVIERLADVT
jgi:hypothetical protein